MQHIVAFVNGAVTEAITGHIELIYEYFWRDKHGSITGCYEESLCYFDNIEDILKQPKLLDDIAWILDECQKRGLIEKDNQ